MPQKRAQRAKPALHCGKEMVLDIKLPKSSVAAVGLEAQCQNSSETGSQPLETGISARSKTSQYFIHGPVASSISLPETVPSSSFQHPASSVAKPLRTNHSKKHFAISDEIAYCRALLDHSKIFYIDNERAVAMADWDSGKCQLRLDYFCVIEVCSFPQEGGGCLNFLMCTCENSICQRERFSAFDHRQPLPKSMLEEEQKAYCLHRKAFGKLDSVISVGDELSCDSDDEDTSGVIEQLETEPCFIWAAKDCSLKSFGIIRRQKRGFSCLVCKKSTCSHIDYFIREMKNYDIELPPDDTSTTGQKQVISKNKIELDDDILRRYPYPVVGHLTPDAVEGYCCHGNPWSRLDPVVEKWRICDEVTVYGELGRPYKAGSSYFRCAEGQCGCRLYFDGSEKGLLNLNNRDFVEYRLLDFYMEFYARIGMPLAAFYDSLKEYNRKCDFNMISYDRLYSAWSAFANLVHLENEMRTFCPECGRFPDTIILDGTSLACRKDLLPKLSSQVNELPTICGTNSNQRVFLVQNRARLLLRQYATGKVGSKNKPLTATEFVELLQLLQNESSNPNHLYNLILELSAISSSQAPGAYLMLLRELSKNTPLCGMMQIGFEREIQTILADVIDGSVDIASAKHAQKVECLRRSVPAVLECLLPIRKMAGSLPSSVRGILQQVVKKISDLFANCVNRTATDYMDAQDVRQPLAFFPWWPVMRGLGKYEEQPKGDEADLCTKLRHGHKVLGPGIITYICRHGVVYGFAVMESCESPRMPFEIFMTRYMPKNIVYDNACKLHLYCLKREPAQFWNTRFFVDRFHWYNHSACSIGYDLRRYKTDECLRSLNSQANEQLNSCLAKLRSSLSYMKFEKFMNNLKLFFFLHNINMCHKL